jgi:two-component system chemotaxis response regulator CheB
MANRDIVAIGTSAGGVDALLRIAETLPSDIPAAILMTIHMSSSFRSELDALLTRAGKLPAGFAADGEELVKGRIFLAPPGKHLLLVKGDTLKLGIGPRENNTRPAIDPMLRSVALCCGPRAVGVVLTGTLGDGASGLWAISQCGGISIVQDPRDAAFPEMPENALRLTEADHVVGLDGMAELLTELVNEPAGPRKAIPQHIRDEIEIAQTGHSSMETMDRIGRRSLLTCPDCNGVMWEVNEGDLLRYRCHVGHTYSADVMQLAVDDGLRKALAIALRVLDERVALAGRLHENATKSGHRHMARDWAERRSDYERERDILRDVIVRMRADATEVARRTEAVLG